MNTYVISSSTAPATATSAAMTATKTIPRLTTKSTLKKRCRTTAIQTAAIGKMLVESSSPLTQSGMRAGKNRRRPAARALASTNAAAIQAARRRSSPRPRTNAIASTSDA